MLWVTVALVDAQLVPKIDQAASLINNLFRSEYKIIEIETIKFFV